MFRSSLAIVIGTRPEAIKLAPVASALEQRGLSPTLLLTGQHPQLDLGAFSLGSFPARHLHQPSGGHPLRYAETLATEIAAELRRMSAKMVMVQGDTASALSGALAGFRTGIPVAHVEAGLRTFDAALPWPEEDNRVAIDAAATLLFAPTKTSATNLRAEAVPGEVHITGNTGIDALRLRMDAAFGKARVAPPEPRKLLVTCHRRENWGAAFFPVALALLEIVRTHQVDVDLVLHPNPAHARIVGDLLAGASGIRLLPPLDHRAMLDAMLGATLILSDSGGVQEEAPALGVPLLVLRSKTERPEGIDSGNMKLVGTDPRLIVDEVGRLLTDPAAYAVMARPALPYGDGHAAGRIAAVTASWLQRQQIQPVPLTA